MKHAKPKTQKALVIYTTLTHRGELSSIVWIKQYLIFKWATRVGELEKIYGPLFSRSNKKLVIKTFDPPKIGHYVVYKPVVSEKKLLHIYAEINK